MDIWKAVIALLKQMQAETVRHEANAASYQEVLEKIRGPVVCWNCDSYTVRAGDDYAIPTRYCEDDENLHNDGNGRCVNWHAPCASPADKAHQILSTTADSKLLARLRTAEDELRKLKEQNANHDEAKPTGIIRRVDDLGRIVIPREVRRRMGVAEDDALEICIGRDEVILRKYMPEEWEG